MSERDRAPNQGQRQSQRQASQGSQPPGGPQQPPQRGGRPPGGGGSLLDRLREPEPKRYIVGVTGMFATLAVATFLVVLLTGAVGGLPIVPDGWDQASDSVKEGYQKGYINAILNMFVFTAPVIALGLVTLAGGFIGSRMDRPRNEVLATAATAAFAGAFVFIVLGIFLASTQYSNVSVSGVGSGTGLGGNAGDQSVEFVTLLLDGIVTGACGAVAAAGSAFFASR